MFWTLTVNSVWIVIAPLALIAPHFQLAPQVEAALWNELCLNMSVNIDRLQNWTFLLRCMNISLLPHFLSCFIYFPKKGRSAGSLLHRPTTHTDSRDLLPYCIIHHLILFSFILLTALLQHVGANEEKVPYFSMPKSPKLAWKDVVCIYDFSLNFILPCYIYLLFRYQ